MGYFRKTNKQEVEDTEFLRVGEEIGCGISKVNDKRSGISRGPFFVWEFPRGVFLQNVKGLSFFFVEFPRMRIANLQITGGANNKRIFFLEQPHPTDAVTLPTTDLLLYLLVEINTIQFYKKYKLSRKFCEK